MFKEIVSTKKHTYWYTVNKNTVTLLVEGLKQLRFLMVLKHDSIRGVATGRTRGTMPIEKVLLIKRRIHISGPQLNIIASTLELLKRLSEVIVKSKCGPPARTEKQTVS